MRHAGRGQRLGGELAERGGGLVEPPVERVVGQPQRGQSGGAGQRVTGERPGLVDRAGRGELRHDLRAPAERRGGQAATHDLPVRPQVRVRRVEAVPSGAGHPEPGHHLVDDEQRAVRVRDPGQFGVEAVTRGDHAHVAGGGLGDDRGDVLALGGERLLDRAQVVVRQHDRVARRRAGHAGRVGQAERGHAGAGGGEQRVRVAVVAAGELDDFGAAGEAAGQPDRRHGRLGTGVDQAHLLDRRPRDDLLGEVHLTRGGRAEARAQRGGLAQRLHHRRVRVAENERAPGADQVDVPTTVGVEEPRTLPPDHEARGAADGTERAHGRVHPAGHDGLGAVEQGLGGRGVGRVAAGSGGKRLGHDGPIVSASEHCLARTPRRGLPGSPR